MPRTATPFHRALICSCALIALSSAALADDLVMAVADDPDALDPVTNRSQVGDTVIGTMCERLVKTDPDLNFEPGLAESWSWSEDGLTLTMSLRQGVQFHDGTEFNAEAVKAHLDRALTQSNSQRKGDLSSIDSIEVTGTHEVTIHTKAPAAQLVSKFAERSGPIYSPSAVEQHGDAIGANPVCAGPYRFVERVAQDRIVLEKDEDYDKADSFAFDTITFRIIPDDSVRLANLQSGDVDIIEKVDPSTVEVLSSDESIEIQVVPVLNNQALMYNLEAEGPFQDPAVRNAFELSLDRNAINQVAFDGRFTAGNQFAPPGSPYYNTDHPIPERDVEKARQMLIDAGFEPPVDFEILVPNRPLSVRVAQIMQAMSNEAGFNTTLNVVDFATTLKMTEDGDFTAWGPIGPQYANDPDNVSFQVLHSTGGRNLSRYYSDEMDALLDASRTATDPEKRVEVFREVAALADDDEPVTYLYHLTQIYAHDAALEGIHFSGDGFIQFEGVTRE